MAQRVQSRRVVKNSQLITITFPAQVNGTPVVVVSSHWDGANSQVNNIETILDIDNDKFKVISNNAAPNSYINWVAVGDV